MILKVFSLLDTKVGMFTQPFFFHHVGQAMRAVAELGSDTSTTVGRHPSDFSLVEIGTFDDATGVLQPIAPISLGVVTGFLQPAKPMALPFAETENR